MPDPRLVAKCQARCGSIVGGRWTLERLIGMGGMASVYLAVHSIGRREAVKILHPELATASDIRQRFEREAQAVNQLGHPGAVDIRDMGLTDDGCPFLVMELLSGESLKQRVDRLGDLPREELLRYVDELLDVLGAAHEAGIIHRDIKLDNLFVTAEGKLKVLDFGIAHVRAQKPLTRMGELVGTLTYMAPEQVAGIGVDARTDLFAVGATMFRVIARRRVHDASSELSLVMAMGTTSAPPLSTVAPWVDEALAAVVDRALQFRKEDRFQSAAEMQAAVRTCRASPPMLSSQLVASGPSATTPLEGAPTSPIRVPHTQRASPERVTQSMKGAPAGSRTAKVVVVLGALVVALTMAVILLVWTRPHDAAAGDDDSRTDPSSKPKKKKAAREKATGEHASAKPTSASSERRSPSAEVTAKDFLAGAAGEVPLAIKKQFGADARLVELVLMPGVIAPSLASPGRADTLVHYNGRATFEGDIVFDKGSEIPTSPNLASTVFTLDTIDFGKIPGMVKDARARVGEKKNSLTIVLCMRGAPEPGFTTLGPVRCSVLIEAEHGKENLEYETDGKFRQTLGR